MVRTRDQRAIDRSRLERLTLDQLREEAQQLHLPTAGDRKCLTEAILLQMEKADSGNQEEHSAAGGSEPPTSEVLQQVLTSVSGILQQQMEAQRKQEQFLENQQQQFTQLVQLLTRREEARTEAQNGSVRASDGNEPLVMNRPSSSITAANEPLMGQRTTGGMPSGNAVSWLASQVPEFGGTEEDNVQSWIRRVDRVAQVHGASDGVTLLAATSKLTKSARRWYDIQTGTALESWRGLKVELEKVFDRKIPYYKAMQKVESRKWNSQKETFDQYAIDKLALMHRLNLSDEDSIQILAGGIVQSSLRATALSVANNTLDAFLEKMRQITQGIQEIEKKGFTSNGPQKAKEAACKNCGKKGHHHKDCRGEATCFYCKEKGHRTYDCPSLKKKEQRTSPAAPGPAVRTAASVESEDPSTTTTVAAVSEASTKLEVTSPFIEVCQVGEKECSLLALVDTGSPVSFIKVKTLYKYIEPNSEIVKPVQTNLRNLSSQPLDIIGKTRIKITLSKLNKEKQDVELYILNNNTFEGDLILGRDFLSNGKLTLVYTPVVQGDSDRVNLFASLPLCVEENFVDTILEQITNENTLDLSPEVVQKLIAILTCDNKETAEVVEDGYSVQVKLKDTSIYAFAPRRFAYAERLQLREITDTLLKRGIIKPSISPYCARVVLVKKKNGQVRLCVDLRPLNCRVEKQKYPFPLIEDCLTKLSKKEIFTLLDMKDGFHQIKVHEDSTKYFSFATPDGQYEYTRLPFGYCEAPAEFQKRIVQILNPLIRDDKIIVYIDDILIPTESVEQNLSTLEEVLKTLKKHGFELNFKKCQFLKKKIEFLGYVISAEGIELNPRHIEAVKNFKQPRNLQELQRFLGLCGYFRKFIQNYAIKARPLQNLLKKSVEFKFDDQCEQAFQLLQKELTSKRASRLRSQGRN